RVRTLVYNTDMVRPDELPGSVLDLTGPAYRGKVAVAPSNGSFQDFVSGLREDRGDDTTRAFLEGLRDNGAEAYANNTAIVEAVARGEIEMGLVNHYYIARAKAEDADVPLATHFFGPGDPGRMLLITAVGIVDSAGAMADEASRLVSYLLRPEAQRYFAEETFEYPLATEARAVPSVASLEEVEPTVVELGPLGADLEATIEMIEESGLSR
ncbi:MAG TPA: extracellular solute-binding protein, partial [Acidimicrobiales bacterium]|nr:extracellular solute-binding protein [Acidimicrobiales bacterium]